LRPLIALPVWPKAGLLTKAMEKANEYGFDYVEVSLDYPWPEELKGRVLSEIKESKERLGVDLAIHAPWRDIALASPRNYLREASLKVLEDCLRFSAEVEALYFNAHVATREAWAIEAVRQRALEAALESVKQLALRARELGVELTIENNPEPSFGVPSALKPLLEVEGVRLCLDVGHVAYANWVIEHRKAGELRERAASLDEWVEAFKGRVLVGHLHDYSAEDDTFQDHLLPGEGKADVKGSLELLLKSGCEMLLLEVHWASKGKPAKFSDLHRALKAVAPYIKGELA